MNHPKNSTESSYSILSCLHKSESSTVFRARTQDTNEYVILKGLHSEFPTTAQIAALKTEFRIVASLDSPYTIKPLRLDFVGNKLAIVFPDLHLSSLAQRFKSKPPKLRQALEIAIQVTKGLVEIHRHQIVHCDITPDNILISPQDGSVKIIDFSICKNLTDSSPSTPIDPILEGTPAYLAPEQTGKYNHGIDQRTDLYALGMTFYWLLTGRTAFEGRDTPELIHQHLARRPDPLESIDPNIPAYIGKIITKLLEKAPFQRYQNASHLLHDLNQCVDSVNHGAREPSLKYLDKKVAFDQLTLDRLVCRDSFLKTIKHDLNQHESAGHFMIWGQKGVGKSSILKQIDFDFADHLVGIGKFDADIESPIPFMGISSALRMIVQKMLQKPKGELNVWLQLVSKKMESTGLAPLWPLIPELQNPPFVQTQDSESKIPSHTDLSARSAQNITHIAIRNLINSFSSLKIKIILLIDDIHNCDEHSIQLLNFIIQSTNITLVTTADKTKALSTIPEIKKSYELKNFSIAETAHFVGYAIQEDPALCQDLSDQVYRFTLGNPGKIFLILQLLVKQKILVFSEQDLKWNVNLSKLDLFLVDLSDEAGFGLKIEKISPAALKLAIFLSHLGEQFYLDEIFGLQFISPQDLAQTLVECLDKSILYTSNSHKRILKSVDINSDISDISFQKIKFSFYKPTEAKLFYNMPSKEESESFHYAIGQMKRWKLEKNFDSKPLSQDELFATAYHLNKGASYISDPLDFQYLAQLNLRVGLLSFESAAFILAADWFKKGIKLLPEGWQSQYDLMWSLTLGLLEASHATGTQEDHLWAKNALEKHCRTPSEKTKFYEIIIRSHASKREFKEALEYGFKALKILDFHVSENPSVAEILQEFIKTKFLISGLSIEHLEKMPPNTHERFLSIESILLAMTAPAYFVNPQIFPLLVFKMTIISARHGISSCSSYAYGVYGVLLCAAFGSVSQGFSFGQMALRLLAKQPKPNPLKGKVLTVFYSSISHWKEPLGRSIDPFHEAFDAAIAIGDFEYASISAVGHCAYSFLSGINLEIVDRRFNKFYHLLHELGEHSHILLLKVFGQTVHCLSDQAHDPTRLHGSFWDEVSDDKTLERSHDKTTSCVKHIASLSLCYLFNDHKAAAEHALKAEKLQESILGTAYLPLLIFYATLNQLSQCELKTKIEKAQVLTKTFVNIEKFKNFGKNSPENYLAKSKILIAEQMFMMGQSSKCLSLLEEAANLALQHENWQDAALAFELAANHYKDMGQRKVASIYLNEALTLYEKWGAHAKVKALRTLHSPLVSTQKTNYFYPDTTEQSSWKTASKNAVDYQAFAKISKSFFGNFTQDQVFDNILKILSEYASAEKSLIVFNKPNNVDIMEDKSLFYLAASLHVNDGATNFQSWIPLKATEAPHGVFRYAMNTGQTVSSPDALKDDLFRSDIYVQTYKVRSFICVPMTLQDKNHGFIYLESNHRAQAFSATETTLVSVLGAFLTTNIDNKHIYRNLEQIVNSRTKELSETMKKLHETQEQMVEARKLGALNRLVSGVAHEINTPLGIAITLASTLSHHTKQMKKNLANGLKKSSLEEYLTLVTHSGNLMEQNLAIVANQVEQFKSTAVANNNEIAIDLNLKNLIKTAIDAVSIQQDLAKIKFELEIDDQIHLTTFPGTLTQILYNLIKNAKTHAFADHTQPLIHIKVIPDPKGKLMVLEFKDNGKGIAPENITKIFDPFYSTSRSRDNMGLGLHIVQSLVHQKLLGKIQVNSTLGQGTIFKIEIPQVDQHQRKAG